MCWGMSLRQLASLLVLTSDRQEVLFYFCITFLLARVLESRGVELRVFVVIEVNSFRSDAILVLLKLNVLDYFVWVWRCYLLDPRHNPGLLL